MGMRRSPLRSRFHAGARWRRGALVLVAVAMLSSACGSRLSGQALKLAEGVGKVGSSNVSNASSNANSNTGSTNSSAGNATASNTGGSGSSGSSGGTQAAGTGSTSSSGNPCSGVTSSNNGGATDIGVTGNQILVGNITSITGVAPGLTQSAQQATQAVAAYINSQGGICGRAVKVQAFDDGNSTSGNFSAARTACTNDFAMVGNASGFDDGSASAVSQCGIPDAAAEVSTHEAGNVAQIFGASPGNSHHWGSGAAVWLKQTYPNAAANAAMLYLQVPATQEQATSEMNVYSSVGFQYKYTVAVSPTEPNYSPYVQAMESKGIQYVTEYSDDNSAARLSQAMQQANFTPQVIDWFAEMYTPAFLSEVNGTANGNLVLMATAPYEEANSNPGMQLFMSWMNRVAPGFTHDIFAEFAWSAGLAFYKAAQAVGPHLTRAALLQQLAQIHQWDGGGVQPPEDYGSKIPSQCFMYDKINGSGNGFTRVYPSSGYQCSLGSMVNY
jgi:ABC-type branched-subunit amino acid transport system substrate-binding protein